MDLSHLLPFSLLVIPLAWGSYGALQTSKRSGRVIPVNTTSSWPMIINSAVLYALSFNIIFFIQELFLALGKKWLGLKAYLYHNNHNWEGQHPMEGLAQGYGAAAIFICGILCLFIARRIKLSRHWLQLFFLWMAFQGFAQSLPQFITAMVAPDTDTGQAFTYLGITNAVGLVISIACIIMLLLTSMAYSQYLLQLAPSHLHTDHPLKRFRYLLRIAVWASLIGVILITPFRIPPWDRALAPVFVTLASVPMILANAWFANADAPVNNKVNQRVFISPIISLAILLLIFQLILAKGVEL